MKQNKKKRKLERGGQRYHEFIELHTDPDCKVETHFFGYVRSGFYDVDLNEASAYAYKLHCKKHGSNSVQFNDMVWLAGAIDKRAL